MKKASLFFLYTYVCIISGSICNTVTKVVIPVAGHGTRFLPSTKIIPKEMLPLMEKPIIHEIVKEALQSDLRDFVFVAKKKQSIFLDYFQPTPDLESFLQKKNKQQLLSPVNLLMQETHFSVVHQSEQLGLGHAILMSKPLINNEYFIVFLPDNLIFNELDVSKKLIEIVQKEQADIVFAIERIADEEIPFRGIVSLKNKISDRVYEISRMVEKPTIEQSPTNLAVAGRYLFSPEIFSSIEVIEPDIDGEIQLTDAINHMIQRGKRVLVYEIEGKSQDTGRPLPWLEANIRYALSQPQYKEQVKLLMQNFLQSD